MPQRKQTENDGKSSYEKRIISALRQLAQQLDMHSRQLLRNQKVTVPQVMCLDKLNENGSMTVAVLAHAIHLSPSTTVGIIDRLEKKKYVTRTRDGIDRRMVAVAITQEGRHFLKSTPHLLHNKLHDHLQTIPEPELSTIANSLDRLLPIMHHPMKE